MYLFFKQSILFFLLFLPLLTFGQNTYQDSLNLYNFGLKQIEIASKIVNKNDDFEGGKALKLIFEEKEKLTLNKKIKPIGYRCDLMFNAFLDWNNEPNINANREEFQKDTSYVGNAGKFYAFCPGIYKKPIEPGFEVILPFGRMTTDQFIKQYGTKVFLFYFSNFRK